MSDRKLRPKNVPIARDAARKATLEIEHALDDLHHLTSSRVDIFPSRIYREYKSFWEKAKGVVGLFKEARLLREDRQRLWERYQSLCKEMKSHQERDEEERQSRSKQSRELIMMKVHDAENWAGGATSLDHIRKARGFLSEAMDRMKEGKLLKDDREWCWGRWKEANHKLGSAKEGIFENNYLRLKSCVGQISNVANYGDPYEAITRIKEIQQEIRKTELSKDQRGWLRESLQDYWKTAIGRVQERREEKRRKHEEWLRKQEEWKRKNQEWRERMEAKCERLSRLIDKNGDVIARIEKQIDDLEEKISSAWNEDWADMARGWVEEKYRKIADIQSTNRELERKIEEISGKLNQ